jgi:hypothetical protein
MTSWTNDGVIRQASLQEVRERTDKGFRPDWSICQTNTTRVTSWQRKRR